MKIGNNKVVTLHYKLQEATKEGALIQEVNGEDPFAFVFGAQQVLPDFETHLIDKTVGDSFEFGIKSDDGYGPVDENAIVDLPIDLFMVEGKLGEIVQEGNFVPMNDQEGNPLQGLVKEIKEKHVKMDFNHPMAGIDLYFSGKVTEVREASAEELDHGHAHGEGGEQH